MATVLDVIAASLREIGVLAAGETASSEDAADALAALNRLLDQWAAERLQIYAVNRVVATLTANQASFTVGATGNINIARPVFIEKVNFIDTSTTPDTEYQLPSLLTEQAWAGITMKALTGVFPTLAYYSPTYPMGTLYPWPIPTSATLQWAIYHWDAVAAFANLTTAVAQPPGYARMIVKNLALELLPSYSRQPDPALVQQAMDSKATVKRANSRISDMSFGADALIGGGGSSYNIYTGP